MPGSTSSLQGKHVLVTGATGFIGGRLAERLVLKCGAKVRALVRDYSRAARIARFPIDMVFGDVQRLEDVYTAMKGCDVVFHCAYGNEGSEQVRKLTNIDGTKNVFDAVLQLNVGRVVHLGTQMVYGQVGDGDLDESQPLRYSGIAYADNKVDIEKMGREYIEKRGLPLTVIHPTAVYGPFAPVWTVNVLEQLKKANMILVNGGDGLCNAVYIDDLVSAMLTAAVKEAAVGEVFLISGEKPVTWREFYEGFERMLGTTSTTRMETAEAEAYFAKIIKAQKKSLVKELVNILREENVVRQRIGHTREVKALRTFYRFVVPKVTRQFIKLKFLGTSTPKEGQQAVAAPDKPIQPLDPFAVRFYAAKTNVRIDKAKRILDYRVQFDFEEGMRVTEQWAKWANLC